MSNYKDHLRQELELEMTNFMSHGESVEKWFKAYEDIRTITGACEEVGVPYSTVAGVLFRGKDPERVIEWHFRLRKEEIDLRTKEKADRKVEDALEESSATPDPRNHPDRRFYLESNVEKYAPKVQKSDLRVTIGPAPEGLMEQAALGHAESIKDADFTVIESQEGEEDE